MQKKIKKKAVKITSTAVNLGRDTKAEEKVADLFIDDTPPTTFELPPIASNNQVQNILTYYFGELVPPDEFSLRMIHILLCHRVGYEAKGNASRSC